VARAIATVGGVALAPGVSKNGRLYTKQLIAGMVARAQDRLESGNTIPLVDRDEPIAGHVITQLTHHGAEDDSTRIVGRVTSMSLDESGRARFIADIAPTDAGRTIAALLDTSDGTAPFLRGVSGRMLWVNGARIETVGGRPVETGDELDILGLDYTHKPGVTDAAVDTFAWTGDGSKTETTDRVLIYESVQEALVTAITEATSKAEQSCAESTAIIPEAVREALAVVYPDPAHELADGICVTCEATEAATPMSKRTSGTQGTGGPYADPGYQADKKQRYQLDTKAHAKAAWSYINMAKNAKAYTAAQLKRIKGRIKAALKKFGITAAAEGWTIDAPRQITETELREYYGGDPSMSGSWSIQASNGPINLSLSSYCMDPAELDVILRAAADAACKALAALDPAMDGDVDVPGAPAGDTDGDAGETAPADEADGDVAAETDGTPAPDPAAGETAERTDTAMTASSTPAAETTAAPALSQADLDAAVASALAADRKARKARRAARAATPGKAAESAPAAPVTETGPATVAESEADMIARIVGAKVAEILGPQETDEQRRSRLVQEGVDAALAQAVQSGRIAVSRKGVVLGANETGTGATESLNAHGLPSSWPDKPLHQFSQEEFDQYTGATVVRHVLGDRADKLA